MKTKPLTDKGQFSFDFEAAEAERPFMEHWARLESLAAEEFSEINLCLSWMFKCDGRHWREWFDNHALYEKRAMLNDYRYERQCADAHNQPMRPYREVNAQFEEYHRQEGELTDKWAIEIRNAAVEKKPIPFSPGELDGFDLLKFKSRLREACMKAGVVSIAA